MLILFDMCGRLRVPKDLSRIADLYGLKALINFPTNFNLAPTEEAPIIGKDNEGNLKLRLARFGLIPGWAKEGKTAYSMINARSETIKEKSYKTAFEKRRCIIPVEGFYEWRKEDEIKQPYYFHREDGELMSLAGIWEFNNKQGEDVYSFAVITTQASSCLKPYHDRSPVILEASQIDQWFLGHELSTLLQPSCSALNIEKMDPSMNNPRNKQCWAAT